MFVKKSVQIIYEKKLKVISQLAVKRDFLLANFSSYVEYKSGKSFEMSSANRLKRRGNSLSTSLIQR